MRRAPGPARAGDGRIYPSRHDREAIVRGTGVASADGMRRLHLFTVIALAFGCVHPPLVGAVCGDGLLEPDYELCDDGVANGSNACCSTSCLLVDTDHDGVCDPQDPCGGRGPLFADATLLMKGFATPAIDDAFRLSGTLAPGTAIDPATDGFTVALWNEFRGSFAHAGIPGGAGWRPGPRGGWAYRDPAGSAGGVTHVLLKPQSDGTLAVAIRGRRRDYARSTDIRPIRAAVALASPVAGALACGETVLSLSRCTFAGTGNTLRCRPPEPQRRCPGDPDGAVRCAARNAAAAQDAYVTIHGRYFDGICADLPGFAPAPDLACVTSGAGDLQYAIATASPSATITCVYSSAPDQPGDPNLICTNP